MKIRFHLNDECHAATLCVNASVRGVAAMQPLTPSFEDDGAMEEIRDPPRRLEPTGAPSGYTLREGDLACYAPGDQADHLSQALL